MESASSALSIVSMVLPVVAGLLGVGLGALLSTRRERSQRRLAFVEKQLASFYSPLQGIRVEISSTAELREKIQRNAERAWRDICAQVPKDDHEALIRLDTERASEFNKIIEFDNDKLHKELLPSYRRMADLFRENYWLAEKDTRVFYPAVLEFVEVWERWAAGTLPVEVWRELNHTEDNLESFYRHAAECHDGLRSKLQQGAA